MIIKKQVTEDIKILVLVMLSLSSICCNNGKEINSNNEFQQDSLLIDPVQIEFVRLSPEQDSNLIGVVCTGCKDKLGYFQALDWRKDFFIVNTDTFNIDKELTLESIKFFSVKSQGHEVYVAAGKRSSSSGSSLDYYDYFLLNMNGIGRKKHVVSKEEENKAISQLFEK